MSEKESIAQLDGEVNGGNDGCGGYVCEDCGRFVLRLSEELIGLIGACWEYQHVRITTVCTVSCCLRFLYIDFILVI